MSSNRSHVLIVDDDPTLLRLLTKWLKGAGYDVQQAADGAEAIEAIQNQCPQILIVDWKMPGFDGLQLCRWLREQQLSHYVYTLLLTARDGPNDAIEGLEAGADDFLIKPIEERELLARLGVATRLLEMENRLKRLAGSDSLTGLLSQTSFIKQAVTEWDRAIRHDHPLSCVMLDLDFFKRINDNHGHAVGDEVIRRVAAILKENCRSSDLLARYGGEEFCVLLPETDENQAIEWAERVRDIVAEMRIHRSDQQLRITVSLGVSQRLADTQGPTELVDLADQAMLVAKRSGRDRVIGFQEIDQSISISSNETGPAAMFSGLTARDVMTTIVAGLNQEETVIRGAAYLLGQRINSAAVVNQQGELVGILSEKDIMSIVLWPNWWTTKIKDVMKQNVVCYPEDAPVLSVYDFLCRVAIRSIVVTNKNQPTGIISRGTLLRWFTNSLVTEKSDKTKTSPPQTDSSWPKYQQRLNGTIRSLIHVASTLEDRVDEGTDLVPCLVGSASRMQELINDLLAYSRFAHSIDGGSDIHLLYPNSESPQPTT